MSTVHLVPSSLFFTAPPLRHLGPSSSHFIRVYLHVYSNSLYTPRSTLSREEYVYKFAVVLFPSLYRISQLLNVSPEDCIFPAAHTAVRTGQDQYNAHRLRQLMITQIDQLRNAWSCWVQLLSLLTILQNDQIFRKCSIWCRRALRPWASLYPVYELASLHGSIVTVQQGWGVLTSIIYYPLQRRCVECSSFIIFPEHSNLFIFKQFCP